MLLSRYSLPKPLLVDENAGREMFREAIISKLLYAVGKDPHEATDRDWFVATALAVRDRIVDRWLASDRAAQEAGGKGVYYFSLEFLIGRLLFDSLNNLGLTAIVRGALTDVGVDLDRLRDIEPDAALGNGGLGRLAACFLDSMASLSIPACGYGIRYNHGLFRQVVVEGWQEEYPEEWLSFGNPWEFERPDVIFSVGFGGTVEAVHEPHGVVRHVWHPAETVSAIAYDTPVVGWRGRFVNTLRLWSARAPDPLSLDAFNRGDFVGATATRAKANAISQVLYPSDETPAGQELRLRQEYFFCSASLQDLLARHLRQHHDIRTFADKAAIQLNDTHPAIGIAELMRLLVDAHNLPWEEAWRITTAVFSYTNHTLLPEALETWPIGLMERLLPRHMQIIYMINWHHLDHGRASATVDPAQAASVSIIDESDGRRVRMGVLAFVGSHKVNGVSALHTDLMRRTVFRDLNAVYPGRITNKTNGITFRRWLFSANPALTKLLCEVAGPQLLDDPLALERLVPHAGDASLHERVAAIRYANKEALCRLIAQRVDIKVDPEALFDVQIKRIHEYKRQLLNILQTIALYQAMLAHPTLDWVPRVKIFAGKAAASYRRAKQIIRLAHDVARVVNADPALRGMLKVVFLPNYNVSLAEVIIPAADLSEQISTAGMEASGTGNMKLALNGALTIGTLDGANVEIREHVGAENFFLFGLTAQEVESLKRMGYRPAETIANSAALREALGAISSGLFSPAEPGRYHELIDNLTHQDQFLVTADFDSYCEEQRRVAERWRDPSGWWRSSVLNTAHMGWFSSDRTIAEYAEEIWQAAPVGHGEH